MRIMLCNVYLSANERQIFPTSRIGKAVRRAHMLNYLPSPTCTLARNIGDKQFNLRINFALQQIIA